MSPIRLLLAIPALDRGGPDRVLYDLARLVDRERFEPHVLVTEPGGFYLERLPADVGVHHTGLTGRRMIDRYPVKGYRSVVRRLRPDVTLTTLRMNLTAGVASELRTPGAWVARIPNHFSATAADTSTTTVWKARGYHGITRATLRRAAAVVAQSTAMATDLTSVGVPAHRIRTIGNPIDGAWVDARLGEGPEIELRGAPALVAVGRLELQKGFDVAVSALPAIVAAQPDAHLTVFGDGGQRAALVQQAADLGVDRAVTFAGPSPNPFPAYAAADLLVAPSRWEGLSNVVLEALAVGCPVVATNGPAASQDLVSVPDDGALVAPDDPAALAAAVLGALDAGHDRDVIAKRCRTRFAADEIVAAYEDLLTEVTEARP